MVGTISVKVFGEWLVEQADRNDAVGDLARDYIEDYKRGCCYATTTAGLLQHLDRKHGGGARPAREAVWTAGKEWRDSGWET